MQNSHSIDQVVTANSLLPGLSSKKGQLHLDELFQSLDPACFGAEYITALRAKESEKALHLIASYYRERPNGTFHIAEDDSYDAVRAEQALRAEMREVNISWKFPDNRIRFLFNPTIHKGPVNHEWLWQLNRHAYWREMAQAFAATGNAAYAEAFNVQLRDWIGQTDCPAEWNGPGSAWRTIEAGLRLMGTWPVAFEAFRHSSCFADESLGLMLSSMLRQARHLMEHKTGGNWLMMEMNGVYTFATLFPEFKGSAGMRIESARIFSEAFQQQILSDGMQDELSPDYHSVTFRCASDILLLAQLHDRTEELPADFAPTLEKCADAYLALATPSFTQPRTNDCFTMHTEQLIRIAARLFPKRSEFHWVTSQRATGSPPRGETASRFLPWAGFVAMRSDWGPNATYLCFDVGPLGMAHQHQDKLNINLYKGNEELIFDDGGGQYEESASRQYALSAADHNTVLVDGLPQERSAPKKLANPVDIGWISTPEFDYARGVYDGEFGEEQRKPAIHTREVRFYKPDLFCVVDTLESRDGEPHDYELLFQLDTLKTDSVAEFPKALKSDFGKRYEILILPLFPEELSVATASGQTEPRLSGWYVGRNDADLHPATTVSMKAAGVRNFRFATLLLPMRSGAGMPMLKQLAPNRFVVTFQGKQWELDLGE